MVDSGRNIFTMVLDFVNFSLKKKHILLNKNNFFHLFTRYSYALANYIMKKTIENKYEQLEILEIGGGSGIF